MILAALALALTFSKPICLNVPCDVRGDLTLTPHEYNRRLLVETEADRPSGKPLFRSYEVTLNGTEKVVHLVFTFQGPAIYEVKVTLARADSHREVVSRSIVVAVEADPQSGKKR